jgi:putative transposase
MSRYRRARVAGASYFFTVVTDRRRPVLTDEPVRAALRAAILGVRRHRPFVIDAWVLLPDHLHCIWTLPEGDADFGARWALIKRATSAALPEYVDASRRSASQSKRRESGFWQRRFWEHLIRDEADHLHHVDYIHANPLKHGLVRRVGDWPFSTFHRFVAKGAYAPDWCGEIG